MGKVGGVISLSEPDIFSVLTSTFALKPNEISDPLLLRLIKASSGLLYSSFCGPKSANPGNQLCFKTRSQVIQIADKVKQSMPQSKSIFLYRNPLDTTDSFSAAFAKGCVFNTVRYFQIDSWFVYKMSKFSLYWDYVCPYLSQTSNDKRFKDESVYRPLGIPGMMGMCWIYTMETAAKMSEQGNLFDAIVRYEDLCTYKDKVVIETLRLCGSSDVTVSADTLGNVFDEDAHKGNAATSSSRNGREEYAYIAAADLAPLNKMFSLCSLSPAFTLPNTLKISA